MRKEKNYEHKKIIILLSRIIISFIACIIIYQVFINDKYSSPISILLLGLLTTNNSDFSKSLTKKTETLNIVNLCYILLLLILINFALK